MHGSLVRALQGTTTLRPPGLGPSPMMRRGYPGDIARAMNYRLRLALAADVGLAPARGMALLQRVMPGEWPVLTSGAFALALARLAHEVRPHDPATPVALPDPEREREACGLAWWLGVFDRVGRTGRPPMVPGSGRRCVEGLRDLIVPIGLDDMVGLVRAAGEGPFARLRARAAVPVSRAPAVPTRAWTRRSATPCSRSTPPSTPRFSPRRRRCCRCCAAWSAPYCSTTQTRATWPCT